MKNNIGHIRGLGSFYKNGLERLEIWVSKKQADNLPYIENQAVHINLFINGKSFDALLRSTDKNKYVWVSPILITRDEVKDNLANVLNGEGFKKNQKINLNADGNTIYLSECKEI